MRLLTPINSMTRRSDRGFTLVEVLVALVVLSVGLLGMAKMVMVSSHSNDSAYLRSQAVALGYQALDSMRANLTSSTTTGYATAINVMPLPPSGWPAAGCVSGTCSNTALATWDVYAWKLALANSLPGGTGSIVTSLGFPMTATVVVRWDDSVAQTVFGAAATPTNSITLETVIQ